MAQGLAEDSLRWCFSSLGCGERSLPDILALAQRYGIGAVELRAVAGSLDLAGYLTPLRREQPALCADLARGRKIVMFNTSFCLAKAGEPELRALLDLCRLGDEFAVPYCRIFGGFDYQPQVPREILQRCAEVWAAWRTLAAAAGVRCRPALETHDGFSAAAGCVELFARLGESLPVVWDAHHTWRYAQEPLARSRDLLGAAVVHVHVKDSVRREGKVRSVLPGEGDVPMRDLLRDLRERGFAHPVSLEWERHWEPELPALETALDSLCRHWLG